MIHDTIKINTITSLKSEAIITTYCPDNFNEFSIGKKRKTIIILPGGAYQFISEREGEPIALQFMSNDYNAFILSYSLNVDYDTLLKEVFATILFVRNNHEKYHVDVDHIAVLGFSAGGHLAALSGLHHQDEKYLKFFNVESPKLLINALVLSYPVITMEEKYTHLQTRQNITKDNKELYKYLSIEKNITKNYPSTFIWTTAEDKDVNPLNSVLLVESLLKASVHVEFHLYPRGRHGLALANDITPFINESASFEEVSTWFDHLLKFFNLYF